MKFYHVDDGDLSPFYATLAEAKKDARYAAKQGYHPVEVTRVEISTDRENILRLVNNSGGIMKSLEVVYIAQPGLKKDSQL
jgi:hypothetical protein